MGYLKHAQQKKRLRELTRDERYDHDRDEWYECWGRYNGRDHDDDRYYKRRGYYDDSIRFNLKLDIPNFERMMQLDDFLDWLNTVESVSIMTIYSTKR